MIVQNRDMLMMAGYLISSALSLKYFQRKARRMDKTGVSPICGCKCVRLQAFRKQPGAYELAVAVWKFIMWFIESRFYAATRKNYRYYNG